MQLVSVCGHRRLTQAPVPITVHHTMQGGGGMPPENLRPISMCRGEINKHEEIAVRSAERA